MAPRRITRACAGAMALGLTAPALADQMPFDTAALAACIEAGHGSACIGRGAATCIEAQGPGSAGICMGAENAWWLDRMLNTLAHLRDGEEAVTARAERLGWPQPVPSLDAVMAGFETYRDATCSWRAAAWDGIHAGVEEMDCLMRLNAAHALVLEGLLDAR